MSTTDSVTESGFAAQTNRRRVEPVWDNMNHYSENQQ